MRLALGGLLIAKGPPKDWFQPKSTDPDIFVKWVNINNNNMYAFFDSPDLQIGYWCLWPYRSGDIERIYAILHIIGTR